MKLILLTGRAWGMQSMNFLENLLNVKPAEAKKFYVSQVKWPFIFVR